MSRMGQMKFLGLFVLLSMVGCSQAPGISRPIKTTPPTAAVDDEIIPIHEKQAARAVRSRPVSNVRQKSENR